MEIMQDDSSSRLDVAGAVEQALRDAWDLPSDVSSGDSANDDDESSAQATGTRSLKELYRDMEEMGVSVDDLTAALNEAYRDED